MFMTKNLDAKGPAGRTEAIIPLIRETFGDDMTLYADGQFILVECDRQNPRGSGYVDLWKLKLDGSGYVRRLTHFSDYPNYKASNPVVNDAGTHVAFQLAKSREAAGVGHGIFVYDIAKSKRTSESPR
jgi:hypothetical protein